MFVSSDAMVDTATMTNDYRRSAAGAVPARAPTNRRAAHRADRDHGGSRARADEPKTSTERRMACFLKTLVALVMALMAAAENPQHAKANGAVRDVPSESVESWDTDSWDTDSWDDWDDWDDISLFRECLRRCFDRQFDCTSRCDDLAYWDPTIGRFRPFNRDDEIYYPCEQRCYERLNLCTDRCHIE